jgi:hypothetical protein
MSLMMVITHRPAACRLTFRLEDLAHERLGRPVPVHRARVDEPAAWATEADSDNWSWQI